MKQIVFEGYLNDLYPDGIRVHASSAAEAISALQGFAGFRPGEDAQHIVVLPDFGSEDAIRAPTDKEVIRVVPYETIMEGGGGKGGFLQVVIGVVLIVVGYFTGQSWLMKIGAAIALGGLVQMLMPQPQVSASEQQEKSDYLPANKNTTKVGTRIPILYGRMRVYGHLISFNVSAGNKQLPAPLGLPSLGGFNYTSDSNYEGSGEYGDSYQGGTYYDDDDHEYGQE